MIETIYKAFQQNPTRLTYSIERLKKQFNATEQQVKNAKKLYKLNPNDIIVAQALMLTRNQFEDTVWGGEYRNLEDSKDMLNTIENMFLGKKNLSLKAKDLVEELDNYGSEWEIKSKWVKTQDESLFMVKKENLTDYKEEFENFLSSYKVKSNNYTPEATDNILLVYTSDKHIGAKTKENALFENEYSGEIFFERMMTLAKEIVRLNKLYEFEEIVILDLGDTVDGFNGQTTRGGHVLPQNMTNREVYLTFLNTHVQFMDFLVKNCNTNLAYITVGESNHGGDFEWVCNKSLETVLNLKYPEIKTFIGDRFIEHYLFGDYCFIFCHGKDIEDLKYPLPKNLDPKTELWIKSYIDQNDIEANHISFIKGDLHLSSSENSEFFRYKNVPSMYGSSKWCQTNFMKNTRGVAMDIISNQSLTEHYLFF